MFDMSDERSFTKTKAMVERHGRSSEYAKVPKILVACKCDKADAEDAASN